MSPWWRRSSRTRPLFGDGADDGRFGAWGGRYVPEVLLPPLRSLAADADRLLGSRRAQRELAAALEALGCVPTPLFEARRLAATRRGARLWLKREDGLPGGSHVLRATLLQAWLARARGRRRLVAAPADLASAFAVATAAARHDLDCRLFVEEGGEIAAAAGRLSACGAQLASVPVPAPGSTAASATAMLDWVRTADASQFTATSPVGPDPLPRLVREGLRGLGREVRKQFRERSRRAHPDLVVAASGSGGVALGIFAGFADRPGTRLLAVEAPAPPAVPAGRTAGVAIGMRSKVLQDAAGQPRAGDAVAQELATPWQAPELVAAVEAGRVQTAEVELAEALEARALLAAREGLWIGLSSAHALAGALRHAARLGPAHHVLVAISGTDGSATIAPEREEEAP